MERRIKQVPLQKMQAPKLTRVAAYARVSSGKDAMLHSLSAQISYYNDFIQRHPGWVFSGVYADEALTGTKADRENFTRLLQDCKAGKVDMVITKSISRFARNTVTLLETVRELKLIGVDVYFEEQNIHSISADGELMLSILASYAQEESLSASENQKWRIKRNFENGMPWNGTLLGYRYDNGKYIIVPEEAETVRLIFDSYLSGMGITAIMKMLNDKGIRSRNGNAWCKSSVMRVLRNYAYTGNLLLQQTYRENHLTKRTLQNNGELPQYHITDSHEPIIPLRQFNAVQEEIKCRADKHTHPGVKQKTYPFTGMIVCVGCGKHYRRKVTKTGPVWICSTFNTMGKAYCPSKQIPENMLISITEKVLGSTDALYDKITAIRAKKDNTLVFCFEDGSETVKRWTDRSRSESWTEEMKEPPGRKHLRGVNQMAKNITVIPATLDRHTGIPSHMHHKRRVAGYARVSTDSEEQLTSYEAQVDYYTQYIKANPDWQFVAVYTDEGISATNTKRRDGFNRMVQDALDGKIDLIVTKSVSRFARNTVDSLTTVRKLKEKGVEVYFQKENIYTLDSKGELLITIMSSLAQEESRSISENVTWGQRKRFADGKVTMPYRHFLGYRKGADGLPEIVPEEAELVQRIYRLFMQGKTPHAIGKILTAEGIPTPAGKEKWQSSTIESILQNEKYRGDARLQKKFTVDFLQKKMKVNEGEVPQYYVENSHPAIIEPEEWDLVQAEFSRRKALGSRYSASSVFSSMIICGECGSVYGSKVWHSTDKYRRTIWQCNDKFKGDHRCTTPHLYEKEIKELFLRAFGKLMANREHILEDIQLVQATLCDCKELDVQQATLADEMEIVSELIRQCIEENTIKVQNQTEYLERYERHTHRYEKMQKQYEAIEAERQRRKEQHDRISAFAATLAEQTEMPVEFNDDLWLTAVDHATINADETVTFTFKSGIEVTEQM